MDRLLVFLKEICGFLLQQIDGIPVLPISVIIVLIILFMLRGFTLSNHSSKT